MVRLNCTASEFLVNKGGLVVLSKKTFVRNVICGISLDVTLYIYRVYDSRMYIKYDIHLRKDQTCHIRLSTLQVCNT